MNEEGSTEHLFLPPHQRCASHTINLIATKDAETALTTVSYKKIFRATFSKCQALWNKQNTSTQAADQIKESFGVYLSTPGVTRWNSTFDSVRQLTKILDGADGLNKLNKCCDGIAVSKFNKQDYIFLKEYVEV